MKLYLSSYYVHGKKAFELAKLMPENKKIGYIPNACDYTKVDVNRRNKVNKSDIDALKKAGLEVVFLDLKDYFGKKNELKKKIDTLGGVFVRGGNTFILRQAMKLSGFDVVFRQLVKRKDFLYSGYSAGICILAPSLKGLQQVDHPEDLPYKQIRKPIWKGLNFLNYIIMPHYKSDHPESADIDKEVDYCKRNKIPFKALRDGEVIIIK